MRRYKPQEREANIQQLLGGLWLQAFRLEILQATMTRQTEQLTTGEELSVPIHSFLCVRSPLFGRKQDVNRTYLNTEVFINLHGLPECENILHEVCQLPTVT
jgi:hypothetical protein